MPPVHQQESAQRLAERSELLLRELDALAAPPALLLRLVEAAFASTTSAEELRGLLRRVPSTAGWREDGGAGSTASANAPPAISEKTDPETACAGVLAFMYGNAFRHSATSAETTPLLGELLRHSLAVACGARLLMQQTPRAELGLRAFAAGLLHNVGALALLAGFPKAYVRVLRDARASSVHITDLEQMQLACDHTVAGKRVAARWKLPAAVQECAWLHHHPIDGLPDTLADKPLVQVVALAERAAARAGHALPGAQHLEVDDAELALVGLQASALDGFAESLSAGLNQLDGYLPAHDRAERRPAAEEGTPGQRPAVKSGMVQTDAIEVQNLSEALDAVSCFAESVSASDDVTAVCRKIADSVQTFWGVPECVVFAFHPPGAACCLCREACATRVELVPLVETHSPPRLEAQTERFLDIPSLVVPPTFVEPVIVRLAPIVARPLARMLPLLRSSELIGGVLLAAPSGDVVFPTDGALAPLAAAYALALDAARAHAALERLAEELARSNRRTRAGRSEELRRRSIDMIGRMAAGAAHELNNPLAVIAGRAQMLRDEAEDERSVQTLGIIDEQARRASHIVTELMQFAKPDPPAPRFVAVGEWAERLQQCWERRSPLSANQILVDVPDETLRVYVDEDQLDDVAGEIITNALDATTPENARLIINSRPSASDDTVTVSIGDNGTGMPPDVLEHALDPFFSHRAAGRGRGLGLSRAARLVEINGGRLWIDSRLGAGTTVHLALPTRPVGRPAS